MDPIAKTANRHELGAESETARTKQDRRYQHEPIRQNPSRATKTNVRERFLHSFNFAKGWATRQYPLTLELCNQSVDGEYPDCSALRNLRILARKQRIQPSLHGARVYAPARLHSNVLFPVDQK